MLTGLSKAILVDPVPEQFLSKLDCELCLCGPEGIELNGEKFVPDETVAYFKFEMAKGFPNFTVNGQTMHPTVISRSYKSLLRKAVDWEHQLATFYPDKDVRDRVIGSVVAVSFPGGENAQWSINADAAKAPCITGVASVFKLTQGSTAAFGAHKMGSKKLTVSMEVFLSVPESGFAVALSSGDTPEFTDTTPADFKAVGYEYVPFSKAPQRLQGMYSESKRRMVGSYKGRKALVCMGGLSGDVHFCGIGVVRFGAEPAAKITGLLASKLNTVRKAAGSVKATMDLLIQK